VRPDSIRGACFSDKNLMPHRNPASRLAVSLLSALFRAVGVFVCLLPVLSRFEIPGWSLDPLLVCALGAVGLGTWALRGWVRRSGVDLSEGPIVVAFVAVSLPLAVAIQITGGFASPLVVLLGGLMATAALLLAPVSNFLFASGAILVLTTSAMAAGEGWLPGAAAATPLAHLAGVYGFLGVISFLSQTLAADLRELEQELLCRDIRDPETGLVRRSLFHARLVGLLERQRGAEEGVGVIALECATDPERFARAAAVVMDTLRADDVVGREEGFRIVAAIPCANAGLLPRIAERMRKTLAGIDIDALYIGMAFVEGEAIGEDPVACAQTLWHEAATGLAEAVRAA